jgi:hypothetical protein
MIDAGGGLHPQVALMLDVAGCEVEPAFRADPR